MLKIDTQDITLGPTLYFLKKDLIPAFIKWADCIFIKKYRDIESAVAYIKLDDGELTRELKVISKNNSKEIVYIEKVLDNVSLDNIVFPDEKLYEEIKNNGYMIVKEY